MPAKGKPPSTFTVLVIVGSALYALWDLFGAAEPSRGSVRIIEWAYVLAAFGYLGYLALTRRT